MIFSMNVPEPYYAVAITSQPQKAGFPLTLEVKKREFTQAIMD